MTDWVELTFTKRVELGLTNQIVLSDAGFVLQCVHMATQQVNLSQQLHMLRETHHRTQRGDTGGRIGHQGAPFQNL